MIAVVIFQTIARGEWITLPWPAISANLPVWRPDDFDQEKTYPAIVWYGPAGERPDATWIHEMTGGEHFVLVGMGYRQAPDEQFGEAEIADALGLLNALKQTLTKSLSVDPKRIHVGGFGRGAKHSAILLDRDRDLAGGLICSTGTLEKRQTILKYSDAKPIYIGCGRLDGNYPQTLGAAVYFKQSGADTTLEPWPDTQHEHPETAPEGMRQWLRVQAAPAGLPREASRWIDKRLPEIRGIPNPVARWFAYDHFLTLPFVKRFGAAAAEESQANLDTLLKDPVVATEEKWRAESRKLLLRESQNRLLKTLQAAHAGHRAIAERAVGTHAGQLAMHDLARTRELLETANVVTRPAGPKPGPITPVFPPSAPSANPDPGPFFPPGIDMRPAD